MLESNVVRNDMEEKCKSCKLKIAKIAYKEIMRVIESFENDGICFHWDECISVDDEIFHGHEMREKKK